MSSDINLKYVTSWDLQSGKSYNEFCSNKSFAVRDPPPWLQKKKLQSRRRISDCKIFVWTKFIVTVAIFIWTKFGKKIPIAFGIAELFQKSEFCSNKNCKSYNEFCSKTNFCSHGASSLTAKRRLLSVKQVS